MSDDEKFGRNSQRPKELPPEVTLSEGDKARIRAEEEFRAQAKREAEQAVTPPSPLSKKDRAAAEKAGKAEISAAVLVGLPPKERMALNIVTALIVGGGILFVLFMLRGCGSTTTASNPAVSMTPAQMLAVIDDRDKNDPAIAAAFARLDDACPENGMAVADIATTFKNLVKRDTGQDLPMLFLMDQLSNTQEAGKGMVTCVETAAAVVTLIGQ